MCSGVSVNFGAARRPLVYHTLLHSNEALLDANAVWAAGQKQQQALMRFQEKQAGKEHKTRRVEVKALCWGWGVGWMLMESLHLAMSKMSLTLMEDSDSGKQLGP